MPTMPFAEPFGLAWLGFLIYAVFIILALWIFLFLSPWLVKIATFLLNIFLLPFKLVSGKRRSGVSSTMKSGKKLFNINSR